MAKLFVICGHGAGDVGACANGYQEYERVRTLGKRIKELGGNSVMLGDINRNYYADNGISTLNISKDYQILELHLDSATATAKGGHVIIQKRLTADKYDNALANYITSVFPGRSQKVVGRNDLANPNRALSKGYGYRLLECCFISNKDDITKFNKNIDEIAKGILKCFKINVSNTSANTSTNSSGNYKVVKDLKGYTNADNAKNRKNATVTVKAGTYHVYKEYNGMKNVTKTKGKPGSWINPSDNVVTVKKSIAEVAREAIDGKWGNGAERKTRLEKAGYNYNEVQAKVNQLVK